MKKSFLVTELLCFFLGFLGAHRYYTGYIGLGVAQTLTLGGCGIWSFIDFIFISLGKYKDAKGEELEDYNQKIGVGALVLVLALGILKVFGPKPNNVIYGSNPSKTIINNYASNTPSNPKVSDIDENGKKTVKFDKATCKITADSYFCSGDLSEADEEELKKLQNEMR